VEKSVEIKLKSWEIRADFLEIKLGNQPNVPSSPTHFYNQWHFFWGKSRGNQRNQEILYAKLLIADPLISTEAETLPGPSLLSKLDVGKVPMKWIDSTFSKLYVLLCLLKSPYYAGICSYAACTYYAQNYAGIIRQGLILLHQGHSKK